MDLHIRYWIEKKYILHMLIRGAPSIEKKEEEVTPKIW